MDRVLPPLPALSGGVLLLLLLEARVDLLVAGVPLLLLGAAMFEVCNKTGKNMVKPERIKPVKRRGGFAYIWNIFARYTANASCILRHEKICGVGEGPGPAAKIEPNLANEDPRNPTRTGNFAPVSK